MKSTERGGLEATTADGGESERGSVPGGHGHKPGRCAVSFMGGPLLGLRSDWTLAQDPDFCRSFTIEYFINCAGLDVPFIWGDAGDGEGPFPCLTFCWQESGSAAEIQVRVACVFAT